MTVLIKENKIYKKLISLPELNIISSYRHPHLLSCSEVKLIDDELYFNVEFSDTNILTHVKLCKLSMVDKIPLMYQLLTAINFLHKFGMRHGNITSKSVFVSSGKVKLVNSNKCCYTSDFLVDIKGYKNTCLDIISLRKPEQYISDLKDPVLKLNVSNFIGSMSVDDSVMKTSNELMKSAIFLEQQPVSSTRNQVKMGQPFQDHRDIIKIICMIYRRTEERNIQVLFCFGDMFYKVTGMKVTSDIEIVVIGISCYILSLKLFNIGVELKDILNIVNETTTEPIKEHQVNQKMKEIILFLNGNLYDPSFYLRNRYQNGELVEGKVFQDTFLNHDSTTYLKLIEGK